MTQEAIFWTFLATLIAGVHVTLGKVIAQKNINPSINSIFNFGISALVFGFILYFFNTNIPSNYSTIIFLGFCAGAAYGISFITRIQALSYIDSVIFFPISKILGPILAVLVGIFFFKESLTSLQLFGIALSVSVPLLLINQTEKHRQKNLKLGLILLVVSTVGAILTNIFSKQAFILGESIIFFLFAYQLFGFLTSIIILLYENKKHKLDFNLNINDYKHGIVTGVVNAFSSFVFNKSLSVAPLSLFYTIHAHYILIPIIFSVFYYKEHMDLRKFLAVAISMIAIAFLI